MCRATFRADSNETHVPVGASVGEILLCTATELSSNTNCHYQIVLVILIEYHLPFSRLETSSSIAISHFSVSHVFILLNVLSPLTCAFSVGNNL